MVTTAPGTSCTCCRTCQDRPWVKVENGQYEEALVLSGKNIAFRGKLMRRKLLWTKKYILKKREQDAAKRWQQLWRWKKVLLINLLEKALESSNCVNILSWVCLHRHYHSRFEISDTLHGYRSLIGISNIVINNCWRFKLKANSACIVHHGGIVVHSNSHDNEGIFE